VGVHDSRRLDRAQPLGLGAVAGPELLGVGELLGLGRGWLLLVGIGGGRHGVARARAGSGLGRRTGGQGLGPSFSAAGPVPSQPAELAVRGCQPAAPPDPVRANPVPGL
jgi:hypothetical protein